MRKQGKRTGPGGLEANRFLDLPPRKGQCADSRAEDLPYETSQSLLGAGPVLNYERHTEEGLKGIGFRV